MKTTFGGIETSQIQPDNKVRLSAFQLVPGTSSFTLGTSSGACNGASPTNAKVEHRGAWLDLLARLTCL